MKMARPTRKTTRKSKRPSSRKLLKTIVHTLHHRKAEGIVVLDIRKLADFADYFVIATGVHERHIEALREHLEEELGRLKVQPLRIEGSGTTWNILDYDEIIVHLFDERTRAFYDLEHLWMDAKRVPMEKLLPSP